MRVAKVFFNVAGTICVGLGIAGVVLPLLPATPFFLLASACYIRGSDRLYLWLMNHPVWGRYIRNFRSGAGVPKRAKVVMIVMLWGSIAWSMVVVDITAVRIVLVAVLVGVTTLILRLRTLRPGDSPDSKPSTTDSPTSESWTPRNPTPPHPFP